MWPFKRKKSKHVEGPKSLGPKCPHCGSTNTAQVIGWNESIGRPRKIDIWRGQRSYIYRCRECNENFYE